MKYKLQNDTDEDITVTLTGVTFYEFFTVPSKSSIIVDKPDEYKLLGDLSLKVFEV